MTTHPTLFVGGANGKLGRRVVELLLERGYPGRIIAGSRHPERLDIAGVEARRADFSDPAALAEAIRGADRFLLISTDILGPERVGLHRNAVEAAAAAGVGHIVYTSMPNPGPTSAVSFTEDHYQTELAILASGLGYTILRNMWYAENVLGSLPGVMASGRWVTSAGEGTQAHVTREDCARAAAGALLAPNPPNRVLTVTGPRLRTTREIAAVVSEVTGRPIEVTDVDDAALEAGLRAAGVPAGAIPLVVSFDRNTRQGGTALTTDAVERLWGTKPADLREFLAAHRAALTAA